VEGEVSGESICWKQSLWPLSELTCDDLVPVKQEDEIIGFDLWVMWACDNYLNQDMSAPVIITVMVMPVKQYINLII
jgi:hypothetical protein